MAVYEDRAQGEESLSFFTQRVDGEDGSRHEFTITCNGKRLVVAVCPTGLLEDPITLLLSQYNQAFLEDDEDSLQKAQDKIEEIIYEAGWRKFALLASAIKRGPLDPLTSLHSVLSPETFYFCLVVGGGNADVIQEYPSRSRYVTAYLVISTTSDLPRYSARDILFIEKLMGTGFIAKVSVNRQDMCCKMVVPTHSKAVQREYECLKKIADSKHVSSIKAPRLIGFVNDGGDDEGVIGVLEEYVPHTMTLGGFQGDIKAIASERRTKWAEQALTRISDFLGV